MDTQFIPQSSTGKRIALFLVFVIIIIIAWVYTFTVFGKQIYNTVPALRIFEEPIKTINDFIFGIKVPRSSTDAECPATYYNTGPEGCKRPVSKYSAPSALAMCPPDFTNIGPAGCKRMSVKYPAPSKLATCPSEYTNNSAEGCERPLSIFDDPMVIATCPDGYTNTGPYLGKSTCVRATDDIHSPSILKDCPDGYKNSGFGTCIPKIIGRGAGVIGDVVKNYQCPPETPNHRGVWSAGWCDNGPQWPWNLRTAEEIFTWKPQSELAYSKSPGNQLPDPGIGKRAWEKNGLLYYPVCPAGMDVSTANICKASGPLSRTDFKPCPTGYTDHTAGRCRKICPPGYTNTGESCHRSVSIIDSSNMTCEPGYFRDGYKCYKECPNNYTFNNGLCIRPFKRLPPTDFKCLPGYTRKGNKCYIDCIPEYNNTGEECERPEKMLDPSSFQCPPEWKIRGNRCDRPCMTEFSNTGEECVRPESILTPDKFICPSNKQQVPGIYANKCFSKCRTDWKTDGIVCQDRSALRKFRDAIGV